MRNPINKKPKVGERLAWFDLKPEDWAVLAAVGLAMLTALICKYVL
jgi:hypothetical protein